MKKGILFIIPSLNYGGAELLLVQQIKGFRSENQKCFVAILSDENDDNLLKEVALPLDQIFVFRSSHSALSFSSLVFAWRHQRTLYDFVKENNIENIVAHLPLAHFWGRLLKLKIPSARLLVYHHSMQYQANPLNTVSKKVFNSVQKRLASRTDDVSICISNAVLQNIKKHFVVRNPVILYNAIPDQGDKFVSLQSTHAEISEQSSIKLVLPGRLHPVKGHLFFLKVFQKLVHELQVPIQLVIAGGGGLQEEVQRFIGMNGLDASVTLTGVLSNEMLLNELKNADFVVIPSLSEGLGIVGIEALMLGKTVIASDAGGLKEVFIHGKNGYVFKAGEYNSCLNVFKSVLCDFPASILPAKLLREDYEGRFSFKAYMENFNALLKNER